MSLTPQSIESIKATLDSFVKDGSPGLVFHAVDKSGKTLVEHASGTLGVDSDQPMDANTTLFWIASCTKLVAVISVLQLVEQGKIPLDDAEFVKDVGGGRHRRPVRVAAHDEPDDGLLRVDVVAHSVTTPSR